MPMLNETLTNQNSANLKRVTPAETSILKGLAFIHQTSDQVAAQIFYHDGLPIVVMAEALNDNSRTAAQYICHEFLPQIAPVYLKKLADNRLDFQVADELRNEIDRKTAEFEEAKISFACAMVYYKELNQTLELFSIAVGNMSVALYDKDKKSYPFQLYRVPEQSQLFFLSIEAREANGVKDKPTLKNQGYVNFHRLAANSFGKSFTKVDQQIVLCNRSHINLSVAPESPSKKEVAFADEAPKNTSPKMTVCATIPFAQTYQNILRQSNEDFTQFCQAKQNIIQYLETAYPYKWFNWHQHHYQRRVAVCDAIRETTNGYQMKAILENQRALADNTPCAISQDLLASTYSTLDNYPQPGKGKSAYKTAIQSTLTHLLTLR